MSFGKGWQRNHLEVLSLGGEKLFFVSLHVAHKVHMGHRGVQRLRVLIVFKVQIGIRDHKWIALFEWVDPKGVRSGGAEVSHLKGLLDGSHALRSIILVWDLRV